MLAKELPNFVSNGILKPQMSPAFAFPEIALLFTAFLHEAAG